MRQLVSNLNNDSKMFIGDFDSYTIIRHGTTFDYLYNLSKVGLLLYDRILLPAAFFWQSPVMQKLLLHLEPAIANGIMIPVIRDYETTTDIRDYFLRRMDESEKLGKLEVFQQPELASEIASPKNETYVHLLEDINSYAHLDRNSIRDIYIDNWNKDLDNHFDINSLNLLIAQANIPIEQIQSIKQQFLAASGHPQFSRASCVDLIQQLIPEGRCRHLLIERASWLYLKSNADAYESRIYYSHNPFNGMIFEDNLRLLAQTLSIVGITEDVISQLSTVEVLRIRISPEYQRFIIAYRDLLSKVYAEQESIVTSIQNNIAREMKKESRHLKLYRALNFIQNGSVNLFMSLIGNHFSGSDVSTPLLIGSGSASVVSSIIKRIDSVNKAMESCEFTNFKNYMVTNQYKQVFTTQTGLII